ncbi:hypothetical protein VNO80_18196 [Phaseolus coccineus]|uniref:Secreted protein n=1 Tax=Phaseolus coccineus TaxID=3886 RepID=A0AAN9MIQ0_PHACN
MICAIVLVYTTSCLFLSFWTENLKAELPFGLESPHLDGSCDSYFSKKMPTLEKCILLILSERRKKLYYDVSFKV